MKINRYQNINYGFMAMNERQGTKETMQNLMINNLPGKEDRLNLSFSNMNRNNYLESLMNQRQFLLERKNELMNSVYEKEGDITSIKDILDSYEEQMKNLDQQISQEMAKQNREEIGKEEPRKQDSKPKSKEEMEKARIANLVNLSSGMTETKTIRSAQTRIEGEARVLESEIKMDKGRSGDSEITAKNEAKLAKLQQRSAELSSDLMEASLETNKEINEENENEQLSSYEEAEQNMESAKCLVYGIYENLHGNSDTHIK